jgi:two-component system sensor histidine kinase KdpD
MAWLLRRLAEVELRGLVLPGLVAAASLGVATVLVDLLENGLGVPNASAAYLPAVVATALVAGTGGAVVSALLAILLYDYLFTTPIHTLVMDDPDEWLSVVLLLFVAIVVGQLTALQRSRAQVAIAREREARALARLSRELATRTSVQRVLGEIARTLRSEAGMDRVAITLGADNAEERVVADTMAPEGAAGRPGDVAGSHWFLQRPTGEEDPRWARVHQPVRRRARSGREVYRVRIASGDEVLGSIWTSRERARSTPDATATRLMASAADQLGQVLVNDRLAAEAQAAETARQSDALKSALVQSVSHDFRTPLATIRAAAGSLRSGALDVEDQRESAAAIEREVEYLDRMVANLLDLSRIEAGALRAHHDVFELDDIAGRTLQRAAPRLDGRPLEVHLEARPVVGDAAFLDEALANLVDNAITHTPPDALLRIGAGDAADGWVRLTVEDAGPGVPGSAMPHLFEKFYRAPEHDRRRRTGTGIGLAVVRGLTEAMGGRVAARRSELGGLAVDIDLPAATLPAGVGAAGR